ncbi:MAG TPA: S8 family peptidase [Bacillus sp. (in: firmicutes)]|uniref:S8 family peptidase n=1 Tax=Bacillus litorisediminis TaxID=2922713 RepID=UPI001FADAA5C|nr:S8 family peptidase [Bacillus litorisediminis]HWO74284.1 S8 family peptidase [Bacillus sp. (in: firmicutes)]
MFGYSMVQMVRSNAHKLDRPLREKVLNMYKPFKFTPCFLHNMFESFLKKTRKLSVIIEFEKDYFEEGCQQVGQVIEYGTRCQLKNQFQVVTCLSADITPDALEKVLTNCNHVRKIYLNREVKAFLDNAVVAANAQNIVRNGTTLTGRGVTVAVIDTGVYPHTDLEGRIVDFVDFVNQRTAPYDDNGHGTHCAGDVAGNGAASSGQYRGPAPEANIIGVKVLDSMGSGSLDTVMQGVEWCILYNQNNPQNKINVISMSLGSTAQAFENENDDPMVQIVERAWAEGIVVCVAAGNEGPDARTIASPGISDKVITVGALDDRDTPAREDDDVASFSSRGPTIYGETKPDILAPGVNIVSLRSPNSFIDKLQKGNRVGTDYFIMSGTSMATPICAGIVALMLQSNPSYTPQQVKDLLKRGADLWTDRDPNVYGAGYINAEKSIP